MLDGGGGRPPADRRRAVAELHPEQIQAALPRLQPDGVSTATRKAMHAQKGLSNRLQETAAAAAYFLIHQITQVKDLPAVFARMDWRWAFPALAGSAMSYVGAGLNLIGGFAQRLPLGLTAAVQLGGSFINRISPVKVGGMAVNVRYLQKRGLQSSTAIGGVGLAMLVGGVMQVALTAVFVVWAGSKASVVKLPSSSTVLLVLAIVAAAVGLAVAVRPARRLIRTTVLPEVEERLLPPPRRRAGSAPWKPP